MKTSLLIIATSAALQGHVAIGQQTSARELKQKRRKTKSKGLKKDLNQAACTRDVFSMVNPHGDWDNTTHDFHPFVWYHTLEDIHSLWTEDYFDYVVDIRGLTDIIFDDGTDDGLLLEGWETVHIPGSFPIDAIPADQPPENITMLVDFQSSNICKDSRIFVHCWSGISANKVAKSLIALGFTNVHAAGPAGSAGLWDWITAGYDVFRGDTFDPEDYVPSCIECDMPEEVPEEGGI
mmetsp:Transcript_5796/g.8644  ORF Transcript_5796/g.8644 Transcript_5796/m.8644 type:complete len:236 (+) Transcript_5796:121-828(+)|eukprot:CAMPEP_0196141438 /NCGR_PEP_ID=MMETSP0910-20130528/9778_1 /TAXON_ID=49265 /ORGANISM="Thalassiosira rotula, Strain GSO102" /LENGTH=235 /DNA_ID=CAMNT_0041402597 /DNA_START=108 /DNA_END=815 /DNA_ORIENTATION=-